MRGGNPNHQEGSAVPPPLVIKKPTRRSCRICSPAGPRHRRAPAGEQASGGAAARRRPRLELHLSNASMAQCDPGGARAASPEALLPTAAHSWDKLSSTQQFTIGNYTRPPLSMGAPKQLPFWRPCLEPTFSSQVLWDLSFLSLYMSFRTVYPSHLSSLAVPRWWREGRRSKSFFFARIGVRRPEGRFLLSPALRNDHTWAREWAKRTKPF